MRKAVYVGSFDPITLGHVDIIKRGLKIFDRIVIGVGKNSNKKSLFSPEDRLKLIKQTIFGYIEEKDWSKVGTEIFNCLAVDFAKTMNAQAVIRGIRNNPDFEAEFAFAHVNMRVAPEIEHIYLMASEEDHFVSSSIVKELSFYGTEYRGMVPEPVFNEIEKRKKEHEQSKL